MPLFGISEEWWQEEHDFQKRATLDFLDFAHDEYKKQGNEHANFNIDDESWFESKYDEYWFESKYLDNHIEEYNEYLKNLPHQLADEIVSNVFRFVKKILSSAETVYNIDKSMLECQCHDLYTAMYLMTFVSIHNEDEYRECIVEKCHQFFLVNKNKAHAQKRCDKHMQPLRNKRQNQKAANARDKINYKPRGEKK